MRKASVNTDINQSLAIIKRGADELLIEQSLLKSSRSCRYYPANWLSSIVKKPLIDAIYYG
jgi:hypothetical protein